MRAGVYAWCCGLRDFLYLFDTNKLYTKDIIRLKIIKFEGFFNFGLVCTSMWFFTFLFFGCCWSRPTGHIEKDVIKLGYLFFVAEMETFGG